MLKAAAWTLIAAFSAGAAETPVTESPKADGAPKAAGAERLPPHAGKAGLYLRLPQGQRERSPEFYLSHPLVDAVITTFKWSELETSPGTFDFSSIDKILALCKKHQKGLVLAFSTYGQFADLEKQPTPEWLYEKGVEKLVFKGGGVAKGDEITVPKVWAGPYLEWYGKLVKALGEKYKEEKSIWYVMPGFGHTGNINAQPSKGGGPAFLQAGWKPALWQEFCLKVTALFQEAFPSTPLIAKSANQLLKDHDEKDREDRRYRIELREILKKLAEHGVSMVCFGLEADQDKLKKTGALQALEPLGPLAMSGAIRLGIGDDWPLWMPPERRGKQKALANRDEEGLKRILDYAFGGQAGLPKSNVSLIYVLHPEIDASHPKTPDGQNKVVFELLQKARERLKAEDPCLAWPKE